MQLAEALMERADLQKRLSQLQSRLSMNARVQAGEAPAEDPEALIRELDAGVLKLEKLITRINKTNSETVLPGGETLSALLARRDCLRMQVEALRNFLNEASATVMRQTRSEVVVRSTVSVPELQKRVDALSQTLRELEMRIQSANWTTALL